MISRFLAVVAAALVLAGPAAACAHPRTSLAFLEGQVMCPTCHQLLALSHSPIAERMRTFIRTQLAAGASPQAIERELVDQFGPAVLASPPARGFGLLAWLIPAGGAAGAAGAVFAFARAWRRRPPAEEGDLSPELLRRLDLELAAFDE